MYLYISYNNVSGYETICTMGHKGISWKRIMGIVPVICFHKFCIIIQPQSQHNKVHCCSEHLMHVSGMWNLNVFRRHFYKYKRMRCQIAREYGNTCHLNIECCTWCKLLTWVLGTATSATIKNSQRCTLLGCWLTSSLIEGFEPKGGSSKENYSGRCGCR